MEATGWKLQPAGWILLIFVGAIIVRAMSKPPKPTSLGPTKA